MKSIYWLVAMDWIHACTLVVAEEDDDTALVIVLDGLRPDYVTPNSERVKASLTE